MSPARGVLLVADAAADVGLGHLQRSSVLAGALRDRGVATRCLGLAAEFPTEHEGVEWEPVADPQALAREASSFGASFVDSYSMSRDVLSAIAAASALVVIQDVGEPPADAELVVYPSDPAPSGRRRLNGPEYALVSARFSALSPREPSATVETILVTTGAGDPGGRAAELALTARQSLPDAGVLLLVGPQGAVQAPPGIEAVGPVDDLADLLKDVDLVVCGGGGTMVEVCAAGIPAAVTVLAPNQEPIVELLAAAGAVARLDRGEPLEVLDGLADRGPRAALMRTARAVIDGRGPARVAAAIECLLDEVSVVAPASG